MKKFIFILIILTIIPVYLYFAPKTYIPETETVNGVQRSAMIENKGFQVLNNGTWEDLTVKGVNIGMTRPGTWPGEAGISYDEYYRWLEMIGEMNGNTIRIYTIHPPAFYEALRDYNLQHEKNIYLFHGVWIDEEPLVETLDAFNEKSYEPFKEEIRRAVDIIHGNTTLPKRPGHASGAYEADVSPYVLGWILGIEWFPEMVKNVDEQHAGLGEFTGNHFTTENATGFEYFLADIMDHTLSYEWDTYSYIRPISFTNWVSTDLLTHPYEPFVEEDMVSINPNHIIPLSPEVSYFASYHVYPYYPDFLNFDPKYTEYVDNKGNKNNYAGYLNDLIAQHDMPVLIAEFGIPSSRGLTHENVHGWNQGFMSEKEQGEIVAGLYESIIDEGYLGGLIFSWQDEWFKRTWNTMDLDNPDRRPYWSNAQTNEQHFGLLSFDRMKIVIDGYLSDWKKSEESVRFETGEDTSSAISAMRIDYDERYLYFAVEYHEPIDEDQTTMILLNTHPGQGNTDHGLDTLTTEEGMEYLITIGGNEESRILVDSYYDIHQYLYAHKLNMIDRKYTDGKKDRQIYNKIRLPLNKELTIPYTGEVVPFSDYETGKLREGTTDLNSAAYDSLADYKINYEDGIVEVRIPWLLIGFADPSTKEILGDFYKNGIDARLNINEISFGGISIKDGKETTSVNTQEGLIKKNELHTHTWNEWTEPVIEERLKKSYPIIRELFSRYE